MDAVARPGGARLNGWKEIASHFGRTVRTVQRWERELGLPVHRLTTGKGETVFALVEELDRWLAENERTTVAAPTNENGHVEPGGSEHPDGDGSGHATSDVSADSAAPGAAASAPAAPALVAAAPAPVGRTRRSAFIIGGAFLLLAAASFLAMWYLSGTARRGVPSAYRREGRLLTVFDQAGRELWQWRMPVEPYETSYAAIRAVANDPVAFADLEGDGTIETVFTVLGRKFEDCVVRVFEEDGTPRFAWQYRGRKHFGDQTYASPWVVRQSIVRRPAGGPPELWVVVVHAPWFPAAVIRLDHRGKVVGEFWHPGHIWTVVPASVDGRDVLLVGAGNNEFRAPALAVVDPRAPSTAPALDADYRCSDCPPPAPLRYLLFPRLLLSREFESVAGVSTVTVDGAGQMVVSAEHLGVALHAGETAASARVYYILDQRLAPLSGELSEDYVRTYRRLQAEDRLTRPLGIDDETELWPIREWNGSAFVPLPVPR